MAVPEKKVWRLYTYECIISRMKNMSSAVFLGLCFLLAAGAGWGQDTEFQSEPPPPRNERFVPADGLMFPERSLELTCGPTSLMYRPDCPVGRRIDQQHILEILDDDGSLWYRFSVYQPDPAYFINVETLEFVNPDFKPLGLGLKYPFEASPIGIRPDKTKRPAFPRQVVLRLVAESPNWSEVEVNEDTRLRKYISKQDPFWARIGWQDVFSISYGGYIVIDSTKTNVLDKPDGKPVNIACEKIRYLQLLFSSLDGDWMEVNKGKSHCHGWIRWRNGRDILVGSHLNGYEVIEPKNQEQ